MPYQYRMYKRRVFYACGFVIAISLSLVAWKIFSSYIDRENIAREQSRTFVHAIEAHVFHSLQLIDLSLLGFSNALGLLPPAEQVSVDAIKRLLSSNGSLARSDYWVLFIDANGRGVAASNDLSVAGTDYSDRDYFRVHKANGAAKAAYVGEPDFGRVSRKRVFFLSRRVEDAAGRFLGVIAAPIEASRIASMFRHARFRDDVVIKLVHENGKTIASAPSFEENFTKDARHASHRGPEKPTMSTIYSALVSHGAGKPASASRPIDGLPLIVTVEVFPEGNYQALITDIKAGGLIILVVIALAVTTAHFAITSVDAVTRSRAAILKAERDVEIRVTQRTANLHDANRRLQDEVEERKEAAERLTLFEKCLAQLSDMVMITESYPLTSGGPRIIFVNNAFERQTGYDSDDVLGRTPRILQGPRTDRAELSRIRDCVARHEALKAELINYRKDGSEYWVEMEIVPVRDKNGECTQFVSIQRDITDRKSALDLIWKQANIDSLTGLPNRQMFTAHFGHQIKSVARSGGRLALMFLDLDSFKEINDVYGHDTGDLLLQEAGNRLKACIRDCDFVGRIGGDEFTILLTDLASNSGIERVAQEILAVMSRPFQLHQHTVFISASIGVTLCPDDSSVPGDLFKNADQAMYVAKSRGRNQYVYFDQQMQEQAQTKMRTASDLRTALSRGEFELYYQPIVNLANGHVEKAEALIRWKHPEKGMISPATFIPLAEDTGTIVSIGDWVFGEAARTVAAWRSRYRPDFQVSINVSPVQFKNSGIPHKKWVATLESLGTTGDGIVVEITERLLLDVEDSVRRQLLMLREAGMKMSLDDFGTGYSSLSYLKKLNIDFIKIDQSFVSALAMDSEDMILCEAMIAMAHKLGLKVVAEGIETAAQCSLLRTIGCDFGQGYHFSKPVRASLFEELLQSHSALMA
ncbi:bifunctional diguanylate cyclase/phosphodiesterase [Noviherbaspirillum humi]|uniref:bifunctional diguanylate cyclase/phosphodiesterase n=1 Tax=Noviherbaspirillum humi TaxID=1688639 RepID=UPI001595255D|nr:EAL domain-containing protein [Noviherbaspirillum humi]